MIRTGTATGFELRYDMFYIVFCVKSLCWECNGAVGPFSSIVVATVMERIDKNSSFFESGRDLLLTWHGNMDLLRSSICLAMQGLLPNEVK